MSLPRDWVEVFVWTGLDKGYCRSTSWELRYVPRMYPHCVVDRVGGYLMESVGIELCTSWGHGQ